MTQKQIINAYITLVRLSSTQMSIRAARDLYVLRKQLEPTYQFCAEQEHLIVSKYNGQTVNGTIVFDDEESARKARQDLQDLHDLNVDLDFDAATINLNDIKDGVLSVNDMETLEGFVALI